MRLFCECAFFVAESQGLASAAAAVAVVDVIDATLSQDPRSMIHKSGILEDSVDRSSRIG